MNLSGEQRASLLSTVDEGEEAFQAGVRARAEAWRGEVAWHTYS